MVADGAEIEASWCTSLLGCVDSDRPEGSRCRQWWNSGRSGAGRVRFEAEVRSGLVDWGANAAGTAAAGGGGGDGAEVVRYQTVRAADKRKRQSKVIYFERGTGMCSRRGFNGGSLGHGSPLCSL